jgi:hypothetical protein
MRLPPFLRYATRPGMMLIVTFVIASSVSVATMKYAHVPFLERIYAPVEARVLDGVAPAARAVVKAAAAGWSTLDAIVHTFLGRLTMRYSIVYGLAIAMIFAELGRGAREFMAYRSRSKHDSATIEAKQAGGADPHARPSRWERWSTGAAVVLPALIAVLYYGAHVVQI